MKIDTADTDPDPQLKIPADPPISPPADDDHARAVRIRSYTTLTTGKDIQSQMVEKHGGKTQTVPSEGCALDSEAVKFNELFHHCTATGKRPADKVFMKSGLAFCEDAAREHFAKTPSDDIALCYEISDYDECFWNYSEDRFCTPEEAEAYDEVLEAVFETKGSYLDEPITEKLMLARVVNSMSVATVSMQGWRIANEDTEYILADGEYLVTGIMDGHGGDRVAKFVKKRLEEMVPEMLAEVRRGDKTLEGALEALFLAVDEKVEEGMSPDHNGSMGTTMNIVVIGRDHITVANAGDSGAVLATGTDVVRLSEDHKPGNPEEKERIEEAGGRVVEDRVEGILAVSRALGDFDFKQAGSLPAKAQAVSPFPAVKSFPRSDSDRFIIQACDGIFDCKTDSELVSSISTQLKAGESPEKLAVSLCDECLSPTITDSGIGTDNMSLHLIVF